MVCECRSVAKMSETEGDPIGITIFKIRELVLEGKYTLQESRWKKEANSGRRTPSSAWNTFYEIEDEDGTIVKDHVCCLHCKKVYKYLQASGTTKLIKHQASCLKICTESSESAQNGTEIANKKDNKYMNDLSQEDRLKITNACAGMVVRDMRPINALYGEGLHGLLNTYAHISLKYNAFQNNPSEYLPSHHTVATNVISQHAKVKIKLVEKLRESFSTLDQAGGAICLDIWTDNYRKVSYMGVTVHLIDSEFQLNVRVIANKALCAEKSKTGRYLKEVLAEILTEYEIAVDSKLITFVTDRGANIKKALENNTRFNDAAHFMHNTVKNVFKLGRPKKVCDVCKAVVAHVKHPELNYLFNPTLKQSIDIRWNSALNMFESIIKNWAKLQEILLSRIELHLMEDVKEEEVRDLVYLLKPFRDATLNVECRKKPTLHLVCIFYKVIENHLRLKQDDSPIITEAKNNCQQNFLETLCVENMLQVHHRVAVFLHPCLKLLRKMTPVEQNQVYQEVGDGSFFIFAYKHCYRSLLLILTAFNLNIFFKGY